MDLSDYPGKFWHSSDPMFGVELRFGKQVLLKNV
jgi:hypothetical protein